MIPQPIDYAAIAAREAGHCGQLLFQLRELLAVIATGSLADIEAQAEYARKTADRIDPEGACK